MDGDDDIEFYFNRNIYEEPEEGKPECKYNLKAKLLYIKNNGVLGIINRQVFEKGCFILYILKAG